MKYFLIVYDKTSGELVKLEEFAESARTHALDARFGLEETHRTTPEIEVVLLAAESEDDIRRTHGRYFSSSRDIVAKLG